MKTREQIYGQEATSILRDITMYRALTEEQRFALALKWPPKGMIFLRFSPERVAQVQSISQKYVEHYNTGNLTF